MARRIRDALQAAGVETWLDETGLGGGDAWDAEIRRRIRDCALFVPIISAQTEQRLEGYFRLEWHLAEQRSHQMALGKLFLVPVVIDDTPEDGAHVPNAFADVQWTRLTGGGDAATFAARVKGLLAKAAVPGLSPGHVHPVSLPVAEPDPKSAASVPATALRRAWPALAVLAALLIGGALLWMNRARVAGSAAPGTNRNAVAVLPFANLTGDAGKDYLGDGMAEELINTLTQVQGLKVPARTSTFAYKGRNIDIRQIARDLGVGTILEGSVRAAGQRIRITAQLINAQDGLHLWSETYDEEFTDLFKLQDKLAQQIARALQPNLTNEAAGAIAHTAGTTDVEAYNLTLQGWSLMDSFSRDSEQAAIPLFQKAVQRDPRYARAWAGLAGAHFAHSGIMQLDAERVEAEGFARQALALDPTDAQALYFMSLLAGARSYIELDGYARAALVAHPADGTAHRTYAGLLEITGHLRDGLVEMRKAYALAPADNVTVVNLAIALSENGLDAEADVQMATFRALSGGFLPRPALMLMFRTAIRQRKVEEATDHLIELAKPVAVDRASLALVVGAIVDPARRPAAVAIKSRFYPAAPAPKTGAGLLKWRATSTAACMAANA